MSSSLIKTEFKNNVFTITLNRAEKGNCYDYSMANLLENAFRDASLSKAHFILLEANGKNFCTGADVEWLKTGQEDMSAIKEMYLALTKIEQPIVGVIQGKIRGGGVGLVAACDIVIAHDDVNFALSEVSLGMVPGIITPFIVHKIGASAFSELSLTGRTFNFDEAKTMGLVHHNISNKEKILNHLFLNDPNSMKIIKKIVNDKLFSLKDLDKLSELSQMMRQNSLKLKK